MESINKTKTNTGYLGLRKIRDTQKISLFNLMNNYQSIMFLFKNKMGLFFGESNLSGVLGVVAFRNEKIEKAVNLCSVLFRENSEDKNEFLEEFDWDKVVEIDHEFEKVYQDLLKVQKVSSWTKCYIAIRYSNWSRIVFTFAKWFLIVFLMFSVLYFLVATEWGRDLSWKLLDVYGYIARILMIILLVVALVVIVVLVSFMYFERKSNK